MFKWIRLSSLVLLVALLSACSQSSNPAPSSSSSSVSASSASSSSSASSERTEPNPPLDEETVQRLLLQDADTTTDTVTTPTPAKGRKKLLSVTPQLQRVWNYCAPTTVSMMLSSRGKEVSQEQLAKEMGTYEPFGTHNRDAVRVLNQQLFGYDSPQAGQAGYRIETVTAVDAQIVKNFKERLVKNIDDGYPMYYTFWVEKLYPGKKGEHNVIGMGYELSEDGKDVTGVYYLDPSPSVQDSTYGGLKKVTPEELLDAMIPCQEPNYAY